LSRIYAGLNDYEKALSFLGTAEKIAQEAKIHSEKILRIIRRMTNRVKFSVIQFQEQFMKDKKTLRRQKRNSRAPRLKRKK
jgi:hypothetical protein